ncbi:ATP-binding protein [Streptomyces sp. NPDC001142]
MTAARCAEAPATATDPRTFEASFAPALVCVGRARRITNAFLSLWGVAGTPAEVVVLAVSELVTNGVEHGSGAVRLRVQYPGNVVCVEVSDGNPAPARLRPVKEDDESGRGLLLVDALAQDWGVSADGRTTWCVVSTRGY